MKEQPDYASMLELVIGLTNVRVERVKVVDDVLEILIESAVPDGFCRVCGEAGVVKSHDASTPVLNNVVVAPITSTIRRIPTNISVGPEEGIDHESVATFDNLSTVPKTTLTQRLGSLGALGHHRIYSALGALADC